MVAVPDRQQVDRDQPILALAHAGEPTPPAAAQRQGAGEPGVAGVGQLHVGRHAQHERPLPIQQPAGQVGAAELRPGSTAKWVLARRGSLLTTSGRDRMLD